MDDNLTRLRQAENRRPDYLKRTKRSLNDTEQPFDPVLDFDDREGPYSGVGIMESPMKGRRLNLFQETSEESFEESLMTGGYERYVSLNQPWYCYHRNLFLYSAMPTPTGYISRSLCRLP